MWPALRNRQANAQWRGYQTYHVKRIIQECFAIRADVQYHREGFVWRYTAD